MEIKAIVFDLDRTLLRSDDTISDETVKIMNAAHKKGVKLVICTGRSQTSAAYAVERLQNVSYIISHAGSIITDATTGEIIFRNSLSKEQAIAISTIANHYDNIFVEAMSSGTSIVAEYALDLAEKTAFSQKYIALIRRNILIPKDLTEFLKTDRDMDIDKFFIFAKTQPQADALYREYLAQNAYTVLQPMPLGIDIIPQGIDKGVAVKKLAKILGIRLENILVAGDSDNDYSMFLPEVLKIAVGNAIPSILEAADYIVPTNDEDGVAYAVRKFVLKEEP